MTETYQGDIDFGKDGRIVVIDSNSKLPLVIIRNKEANTFRLNVGDKIEYRQVTSAENMNEIQAEVIRVLNIGKKFVSGRFENFSHTDWYFPDSREIKKEIIIATEDFLNAMHGDKVYIEIINPGDSKDEYSDLRGKVLEVLGKPGERGTEEKSIIRKFNLVERIS